MEHLSVAVTERSDESYLMQKVVKKLAAGVDVPLVIDTTEPEVMEVALKTAPGRCMLNSTHLESGRTKADKIFALAKAHNATVLIDEDHARAIADQLGLVHIGTSGILTCVAVSDERSCAPRDGRIRHLSGRTRLTRGTRR